MDQRFGKIDTKELIVDGVNHNSQQYNLTVTSTDWTTTRAVGHVYSVSDGAGGEIWRMAFNIKGTFTVAKSGPTLTITGVAFKASAGLQTVTSLATGGGSTRSEGYANAGVSIIGDAAGVAKTLWHFSGDVELNAKPSFVA